VTHTNGHTGPSLAENTPQHALTQCPGCVYARHTLTLLPEPAPGARPDITPNTSSALPADDHAEWPRLRLVPRPVAG
jgi:hypothetical protein